MTAIFAENEFNIVDVRGRKNVFGKNELWEGLKVYKIWQKTAKLLKTIFAINFSSLDKDKGTFTLPPEFGFL